MRELTFFDRERYCKYIITLDEMDQVTFIHVLPGMGSRVPEENLEFDPPIPFVPMFLRIESILPHPFLQVKSGCGNKKGD